MRLRHVLLLTTALGACGSALLALDFYRRLKDAERTINVDNMIPGPDSVLGFGMAHALGLAALALLFLAIFLLLAFALNDRRFVERLEAETVAEAVSAAAAPDALSVPEAAPAVAEAVVEPAPVAEPAPVSEGDAAPLGDQPVPEQPADAPPEVTAPTTDSDPTNAR